MFAPLLLLALSVTGQTPNDSFATALADLRANVPASKHRVTRYIDLRGVTQAEVSSFIKSYQFTLNSTHFRRSLVAPVVVNNALLRIDLESLGWDRESRIESLAKIEKAGVKLELGNARNKEFYLDIWETFAFFDPYFVASHEEHGKIVRGWIDPDLALQATILSGSSKFIVAGHWLYPRLWLERQDGGFYSQLLLFPPTEQDLYKRLDIPIKDLERDRLIQGAAIVGPSIVARHNRELQELPSPFGYDRTLWRTLDFDKDVGIETNEDGLDPNNVLESLGGTAVHKGREVIFSLPDGLHAYFLSDGKGKQVNVVPQAIALDMRPDGRDRDPNVTNAYKCVSCHGPLNGIYPFSDRVKAAIFSTDIGLLISGNDKRKVISRRQDLEEFYLPGLATRVEQQQASYRSRVFAATGLESGPNSVAVVGHFDRWFWDVVEPAQAALEMGVPMEAARVLWTNAIDLRTYRPNPNVTLLLSGQAIRRSAFERAFGDAMRAKVWRFEQPPAVVPVAPVQLKIQPRR